MFQEVLRQTGVRRVEGGSGSRKSTAMRCRFGVIRIMRRTSGSCEPAMRASMRSEKSPFDRLSQVHLEMGSATTGGAGARLLFLPPCSPAPT